MNKMFEVIPKARIFLNLLLIFEIFIGLAIIVVTWIYHRILSTFLIEAEGKMLSSKFFNLYILGFQLVASFLCGLSIWATIWPRRYSENTQLLLSVWLIFCFLIVFCGCATIWTLIASSSTLEEATETVLLKGIDIYYMNPEWKLLWDRLQYTRECCGVHSYQDWMQAAWLSDNTRDYSDEQARQQMRYATTACSATYEDVENSNLDHNQILAPYACCKRNSRFCYENYMPHLKRDGNPTSLPHLNLTDINTEGCLPLFTRFLTVVMHTVLIFIVLAAVIDILICCCTRYLMARNYKRCYREFNDDLCMFDDEGNALVVIKCPPKVRCITLEEPNTCSGSDIPNIVSSSELYPCDGGDRDVKAGLDDCGLKTKTKNKTHITH